LLAEEEVLACQFEGVRYDCIDYALQHPNLREAFKEHLLSICQKNF